MTTAPSDSSAVELVDDPQIRAGCQALVDAMDHSRAIPGLALLRAVMDQIEREQGEPGGTGRSADSKLPDLADIALSWPTANELVNSDSADLVGGDAGYGTMAADDCGRQKSAATRRGEMLPSPNLQGQC